MHDLGYARAETSAERKDLDAEMIDKMDGILRTSGLRESAETILVKILMTLKCAMSGAESRTY
jgi:hypothetical protein